MRAFIIRPFGTRKGVDFNSVEDKLVGPALQNIGAEGRTTGEILESGNIRIDMFQQLLVADLVIADITTNNPNAFYELGIRHALQEKRTFLIRAKLPPAQTLSEAKEADVPFDLKTDRYFEYDPADPASALDELTEALRVTAASDRQDSPVFLSLPNLRAQPRERFIPVPLSFGEDVQRAEQDKDARKLTLLGLEARGFPWESTGLRVVGRALLLIKRYGAAKTAWESLRKLDDYDLEANTALANIYQRLEDLTSSDQALERALKVAAAPADISEIHGQLGRNKKDRWTRSWRDAATPEDKARKALDSPLLMEAYEQYLAAYRQDLDSYYPGLNALFLAVIILDLAGKYPDIWNNQFAKDAEARNKLDEMAEKRGQIAQALLLRFDNADVPPPAGVNQDQWLLSSAGDLNLLTQTTPRHAIYFYKKAAAVGGDFVLDSARKQLMLLTQIGVLKDQIEKALEVFPPESVPASNERIDRVLLFTGHRIDAANRPKPRFPAAMESVAREAIRSTIAQEKEITTGSLIGIAGGANGGDILFLEACEDLGIQTKMLLALPENQFVQASVDNEDKRWLRRFHAQLEKHPDVPVLAESPELPKWLQFKRGYDIWQRNNLWLLSEALCLAPRNSTVIALWDGELGDGPGGTEHMVGLAKERGARVIHLDTNKLFGVT
ncbi:MAG TPA: tetratricopeptide repeat-containing protein [Bryobacteraceae bacterium]|nr:tetratricopeptide repeat-containing protein [Bryobacteraceae bacterium]